MRLELANAVPQIIWTADSQGALTHLNAKATEYTGVSSEQLEGWSWGQVVHPDDLAVRAQVWSETLKDGVPETLASYSTNRRTISLAYRSPDALKSFRETGEITDWIGTCTDIEDLKNILTELRNEQNLLRTLINSIPDEIFTKDRSYKIRQCNTALLQLQGKKTEELIGKTVFELFPRELARKFHDDDMRVLIDGETIHNQEED